MPSDPLHLDHGPTWRNSIALAPLTNRQSHDDGALSDDEIAWLTARAVGGFGLVMTAAAFVAPAGHVWQGQLGVANDDHLPGLRRPRAEPARGRCLQLRATAPRGSPGRAGHHRHGGAMPVGRSGS